MMVEFPQRVQLDIMSHMYKVSQYFLKLVSQKLTGEASRDHKSKVVDRFRAG